jgi:hypothetical protein
MNFLIPGLEVCVPCVHDPDSIPVGILFRCCISTIMEEQMLEKARGKDTADVTGELLN